MTSYVKDNLPTAFAQGEVFLWHRMAEWIAALADPSEDLGKCREADVYLTGCGRRILAPLTESLIHQEMRLADWDAMFGDDVDLCVCAVHHDDAARVGIPKEDTSE